MLSRRAARVEGVCPAARLALGRELGLDSSCGITTGDDESGQLGSGAAVPQSSPVPASGIATAVRASFIGGRPMCEAGPRSRLAGSHQAN